MGERYPTIHSRERITNQAECDLRDAVHAVIYDKARDLTFGEVLRVLQSVLGGAVSDLARDAIRQERHPEDPSKPGGLR